MSHDGTNLPSPARPTLGPGSLARHKTSGEGLVIGRVDGDAVLVVEVEPHAHYLERWQANIRANWNAARHGPPPERPLETRLHHLGTPLHERWPTRTETDAEGKAIEVRKDVVLHLTDVEAFDDGQRV